MAAELGTRGIGTAFHLERPGHRGPHLVTMGRRAAVVVTEDLPVAPLAGWTRSLAHRTGRDVLAVDTACLVPMRSVDPGATDRAYRFRKATAAARRAALARPWPEQPDPDRPFVPGDLPFEPVSLADADLGRMIAECEIDHAVGPVPHTPGGSRAGYARWAAFRESGLRSYAGARNNPLVAGVSRMSPYLHYGQVSPFRIAREAAEVGGRGPEKYLDELLVWRELAHAFCAHHPHHDTPSILPEWARETLAAHGDDPREVLSWETLARGRTGDRLWDTAQRSLLGHGELHNNVRMTWGKALLGWSRNAGQALDRMVDLNHRYALDGRDPASFGGILWCLGVFDRPFTPERPVLGRVRSRSTEGHARRLDVETYRRRVEAPAWRGAPSVAVIGAGVSGLMAARTLADHGLTVTVFDEGPRSGGRANTREQGERRFDDGAPFFAVRDPRLAPWLRSWLDDGVVAAREGRLAAPVAGFPEGGGGPGPYVGVPGMDALPEHLARDLEVRAGVRVEALEREADLWHLRGGEGRRAGAFGAVVIAVQPTRAASLLVGAPELRARVLAGAPGDQDAFLDGPRRLVVCGDGIRGGGIEGALLSGIAAAGLLLGMAPPAPENPLGTGRPAPSSGQLALEL